MLHKDNLCIKLCEFAFISRQKISPTKEREMTKILFVCTGNICRSPMAEGILRDYIQKEGLGGQWAVGSCATTSYHRGSPPDPRAIAIAKQNGVDLSAIRSRSLHQDDFYKFSQIWAMTQAHLHVLQDKAPIDKTAKIGLFGELIDQGDIPDPYYDDLPAFEHVYHLLQQGCRMLIKQIQARP